MAKLYLASESPRRRLLLGCITPDFEIISLDGREEDYPGLTPRQKAMQRSEDKAKKAWELKGGKDVAILTADTVVDMNGMALGKPTDRGQARKMIESYSEQSHYVHTGVSVVRDGLIVSCCRTTQVFFAHIPGDFIEDYVNTSEPYDKAGGYGIQGRLGRYIWKIRGDYYNVTGFPIKKVKRLFQIMKII